jgi:hypothetical protein
MEQEMGSSEDLRKRLDELNREPLAHSGDGPDPAHLEELRRRLRKGRQSTPEGAEDRAARSAIEPIVFHRDVPRRERPHRPRQEAGGPRVILEEAVEGKEIPAPNGSKAYLIERRLTGPRAQWRPLCDDLARVLADRRSGLWRQLEWIGFEGDLHREELLFLDLETTGLGSTPLFLIGTMFWDGSDLVARQYFARDYSEEPAVLALFLDLAAGRRLLVSFNGKTFDLPYVRMRAAANGIPCQLDLAHLDLLHAARRLWRARVPDCRLQTLERLVCGRMRHGDIPGHLIPDAYHAYVASANAVRMVDVVEHNFLDLLTLADLMVRMTPPAQ